MFFETLAVLLVKGRSWTNKFLSAGVDLRAQKLSKYIVVLHASACYFDGFKQEPAIGLSHSQTISQNIK
jgi:hypothetical protein